MKKDDIINDYKIIEEIGRGGMAVVYRAIHLTLNKDVAIKVLNKEFFSNDNIRKRFMAEGRNLFSLSHENLTRVTDLIDTDNVVAIVMEYIDGQSLKDYIIKSYPFSDDKIKGLFSQMLDSLSYIHQKGFIHRDIKPSNFMITKDGTIKLLDFGIAKNTDSASSDYTMTGTSQMMGTPMYMSPEQIKSTKDINLQTDIYSLGVVLWNMVTGSKPYDHVTLSIPEIQVSILKEDLPLTNTPFDFVIQKSLQKSVEDRFKNCNEFKEALLSSKLGETPLLKEKVEDDKTLIESNEEEKTVINQIKEVEKEMSNKDTTPTPPKTPKKKPTKWKLITAISLIVIIIFSIFLVGNDNDYFHGGDNSICDYVDANYDICKRIEKLTDGKMANDLNNRDFLKLIVLLDKMLLLDKDLEERLEDDYGFDEGYEECENEINMSLLFDDLDKQRVLYNAMQEVQLENILVGIDNRLPIVKGVFDLPRCDIVHLYKDIFEDMLYVLDGQTQSDIYYNQSIKRVFDRLVNELIFISDEFILEGPIFMTHDDTTDNFRTDIHECGGLEMDVLDLSKDLIKVMDVDNEIMFEVMSVNTF